MDIYHDWNLFCEASTKDCREKFGEELWSILFGSGEEKDTQKEKNYLHLLVDFIDGDFMGTASMTRLLKAFEELKACEKTFVNSYMLTRPPKNTWVYRGSKIQLKGTLAEILGQADDLFNLKRIPTMDLEVKDIELTKGKKIMYQPRSPIQSWTSDFEITAGFMREGAFENPASELEEVRLELEDVLESAPSKFDRVARMLLKERILGKSGMEAMILYETKVGVDPDSWLFNEQITGDVAKKLSAVGLRENEIIRISKDPIKCNTYIDDRLATELYRLYKLLDVEIV